MKTSITLALVIATSAAQEQVASSQWEEIIEVIDGFVIGALATE